MLTSSDISTITDIATRAARQAVATASTGEGGLTLPVPVLRAGTAGDGGATGASMLVTVDGDVAPLTAVNMTGWAISPGARCMVLFVPPHGIYITQLFDPPHTVGTWTQGAVQQTVTAGLHLLSGASTTFDTVPTHYYRVWAGAVFYNGTGGTYMGIHTEDQDARWIAQNYEPPNTAGEWIECQGVVDANASTMTVFFGYDIDGTSPKIGTTGPSEHTWMTVEDLGPAPPG